MPSLNDRHSAVPMSGRLRVLHGVGGSRGSLGFAHAELDLVVVLVPDEVDGAGRRPVRVLAIGEAKSNPNGIGSAFAHMQETLAFLCGDTASYSTVKPTTTAFGRSVCLYVCMFVCLPSLSCPVLLLFCCKLLHYCFSFLRVDGSMCFHPLQQIHLTFSKRTNPACSVQLADSRACSRAAP